MCGYGTGWILRSPYLHILMCNYHVRTFFMWISIKINKYKLCGYETWWILKYPYSHILMDNYPTRPRLYPFRWIFTLSVVDNFCGCPWIWVQLPYQYIKVSSILSSRKTTGNYFAINYNSPMQTI